MRGSNRSDYHRSILVREFYLKKIIYLFLINTDKETEHDEEEEELKPLINDESHEEQQSLDQSPKVKFEHDQSGESNQTTEQQFPLESRLKYVRLVFMFLACLVCFKFNYFNVA